MTLRGAREGASCIPRFSEGKGVDVISFLRSGQRSHHLRNRRALVWDTLLVKELTQKIVKCDGTNLAVLVKCDANLFPETLRAHKCIFWWTSNGDTNSLAGIALGRNG